MPAKSTLTDLERFMQYVEPEPNTGCWLWTACVHNRWGYGHFGVRNKLVSAHRFAWEQLVGPIPAGMLVLHKCDVPSCCSPDHLFLGDSQANMSDMARKGRGPKSRNGLPFGVALRANGRFMATVRYHGKLVHLGDFDSPEQAGAVATEFKLACYAQK